MNPECIDCCNREEKDRLIDVVNLQHEQIEELLRRIDNIATLIYYQDSIKTQDQWLYDLCNEGIWRPPDTDWDIH